jgi:hypothetical protein
LSNLPSSLNAGKAAADDGDFSTFTEHEDFNSNWAVSEKRALEGDSQRK